MRALLVAAAIAVAAMAIAPPLRGQTEPAKPLAFEVTSVKPHPIEAGRFIIRMPRGVGIQVRGDRFTENLATLNDLIMEAYEVVDYQISGAPAWAVPPGGEHFDIAAKSDGVPTPGQLRQMLQTLLADRFQLKLHRETRELPVYALVIGKGGAKMRKLGEDEKPPTYATRPQERPKTMMSSMAMLVKLISGVVDRPVVDQTGLEGTYEFANLDWAQFGRNKRAAPLDPEIGESIFTAVQQELGLKLEPRKDAVEVLVIDRAEKPAVN